MTASDVRQLRGEDLSRLDWADLPARARSLDEAQRLVLQVDEFDYLAACAGDRVVGIAAVGCRTPFGGASLVSVSVDPRPGDVDPRRELLRRLEQRARELTCTSMDVRVDAADVDTRAVFETFGYGLVGATTTPVPWSPDVPARHVDSWVLRKDLPTRSSVWCISPARAGHQPP